MINDVNDLTSELEVGKEYSNQELHEIFKCSTQGGMRRSHATNSLVLISHRADRDNAYSDDWKDSILYYTGMGMSGDQNIDFAQNKTLKESDSNGVTVYLFEVYTDKKYTYRGIVGLAGDPFRADEEDFNGKMRKVWKFPLKLL